MTRHLRPGRLVTIASLWPCDPPHLLNERGIVQSVTPAPSGRQLPKPAIALVAFPQFRDQEAWPFRREQLSLESEASQ